METSSATGTSLLAIASKAIGCATGIGGPLKPISNGFPLFFETLLSAVPLVKTDITDIIDVFTHTEGSPDSITTDNEAATTLVSAISAEMADIVHEETINVTKPSDAQLTDEVIEVIATESVTDGIVSLEIDESTLTENTTTEVLAEIIATEDTSCATEDITAIDEVVSAITELAAEPTNDITFIDGTEALIETAAPTHEQQASDDIVDTEAVSTTHAEEETDDETVAPEEDETVQAITEDTAHVFENTTSTPALDTTKSFFVEDSESDVKAFIQAILDNNEGAGFETDIEAEVEEAITPDAPASIAESTESDNESEVATPLPTRAYALILEDDFDAAISSIFDSEFETLLDNDTAWSVPQVVEKAKSDKELVRERLAKNTAKFNLQNLRLEKAARALSLDGTAPTQNTPSSNSSTVEESAPASPIELEQEEVIATAEEVTAEPTETTVIEPEQEEPVTTTEDKTEGLEAFSDKEEDIIALAKDIATDANHSRHSSYSSANSQVSVEAGFDTEPYPCSPVTEYSATPEKARTLDTEDVATKTHQATVEDADEEDGEDSTTE
ncbi:hypothetical protein C8A05DRAFT_35656 [Staphylotrichum tortipilum]|uniref:Uncharacterized protein n=1 Tax=Staphylotrichum tortipilum TaxID=2831512 RepID=A0AAN6RSC1_9PEZI|nr:hypothetical protein C8A05DRAFT_35656 [Staphylotrichum longicolle]